MTERPEDDAALDGPNAPSAAAAAPVAPEPALDAVGWIQAWTNGQVALQEAMDRIAAQRQEGASK